MGWYRLHQEETDSWLKYSMQLLVLLHETSWTVKIRTSNRLLIILTNCFIFLWQVDSSLEPMHSIFIFWEWYTCWRQSHTSYTPSHLVSLLSCPCPTDLLSQGINTPGSAAHCFQYRLQMCFVWNIITLVITKITYLMVYVLEGRCQIHL